MKKYRITVSIIPGSGDRQKPVLFEFPTYEYLKTGEVIGKCLSFKDGESIYEEVQDAKRIRRTDSGKKGRNHNSLCGAV